MSGAVLLLVATSVARKLDILQEGLTASYFADASWSTPRPPIRLDPQPSRDSLTGAWQGRPPQTFSTTWLGSLAVLRRGTYAFSTISDDGSWVFVDGRLVVDNGGRHAAQQATGRIDLEQGMHEIYVKYFQDGGGVAFDLRWSRGEAPLEPIPSWLLFPRHVSFWAALAHLTARRGPFVALWALLAAFGLAAVLVMRRPVAAAVVKIRSDRILAAATGIITVSCIINLVGIPWGLPSFWAGDEITAIGVLTALDHHFSHGWFDRYPPFQFQLLGVAYSPLLQAASAGWLRMSDASQVTTLTLLSRLISVAASMATLAATGACGALAFGKRAGVLAMAMLALVPMFVYYSKTANPEALYLLWFALSLLFLLRWQRSVAPADAVLLGVTATLAICTKDQAYGLYVAIPFIMIYTLWRRRLAEARTDRWRALLSSIFDRRLWAAALLSAVLFALIQNLAFNRQGFLDHLQFITGPGSHNYRIVEPTWRGRLELLRLTIDLDRRSWGWPFWLVGGCGVVMAFAGRRSRRIAAVFTIVIAGYYLSFINVILYGYDRFLLPVCLIQALFGGMALDRWLERSRATRAALGAGVVGVAFAYTFLYATTVDVLMLNDSRYAVERWLRAHAGSQDQIGTVFPATVLPRLGDFNSVDVSGPDALVRWMPAYFVLNADYAAAVEPGTPLSLFLQQLQREHAGYRLALRVRSPSPWPWLPSPHPDLAGPRLDGPVLSVLRFINPTMEVYARNDPPPGQK